MTLPAPPAHAPFAPATVPPQPFVAPLILSASAPRGMARLRDATLTTMLWVGWAYLLVAAIGCVWVPPFVEYLLPITASGVAGPTIVIVLACLVGGLSTTALVLGRALRDRRRFAGADRRRAPPAATDAEVAATLGAQALDLQALRAARRIVLHHGADGRIERAETTG